MVRSVLFPHDANAYSQSYLYPSTSATVNGLTTKIKLSVTQRLQNKSKSQSLSENFQPLSTATDGTHDRTTGSVLVGTLANTPKHEKQKHTQSVNDECA